MPIPPEVVAQAQEHAMVRRAVVREDIPAEIGIAHDGSRFRFYNADAWECPTETPFLPWSPPPYPCLAVVDHEGSITVAGVPR